MLDQLVESKSNAKENTRKVGFLIVIFFILTSALLGGVVYDLTKLFRTYLQEGMGGDLELTSLVAPVPVQPEEPPPPPEETPKVTKVEQNVDVRKEIIANMMETPKVPDKIEVTKQNIPPRRLDVKTIQGEGNTNAVNPVSPSDRGAVVAETKGVGTQTGTQITEDDPPPTIEKPKPTPKPVPKVVSGGVVNSKATNLVKPSYPPAAKAVRASGSVNVQVTIDESGRVVSANAVSGHTLLRSAAESAARASRFSPTLLSGQPVKVTGVIVYNFVAQ